MRLVCDTLHVLPTIDSQHRVLFTPLAVVEVRVGRRAAAVHLKYIRMPTLQLPSGRANKSARQAFAIDVHATASIAVHFIDVSVPSGLPGGLLRVFTTRVTESCMTSQGDWRRWVEVGRMQLRPDSAPMVVRVVLSTPIPFVAGGVRGLYLFSTEDAAIASASAVAVRRRGAVVTHDSSLSVRSVIAMSRLVQPFGALEQPGARLVWGGAPRLSLTYELTTHTAQLADALAQRLTSLDDLSASIGPVNRHLIAEWHGESFAPPLRRLRLQPPQSPTNHDPPPSPSPPSPLPPTLPPTLPPATATTAPSLSLPSVGRTAAPPSAMLATLDLLCSEELPACRALWMRWLNET